MLPTTSQEHCFLHYIVFNSAGPNCERVFYRLKPLKAKQGESRTGKTMEFSCSVIMYSCWMWGNYCTSKDKKPGELH